MASLLLAVIYLTFISLGLPDSLLGTAWPVMHVELAAPVAAQSLISIIISCCTIASSLLTAKLVHKLGTGKLTALSVALTAGAILGFSATNAFWQLCLIAIPYGLGAGAIDSALNNYVALNYGARHMSWLHCCWGIGASVGPLVMGWALAGPLSWHGGYLAIGAMQAIITAALFLSLPLWKSTDGHAEDGAANERAAVQADPAGTSRAMHAGQAECANESNGPKHTQTVAQQACARTADHVECEWAAVEPECKQANPAALGHTQAEAHPERKQADLAKPVHKQADPAKPECKQVDPAKPECKQVEAAKPKHKQAEAHPERPLTNRELLRLPGARAAIGSFGTYCALEGSIGLWIASYLAMARGLDAATAASIVSQFFLGITIGRLVSGFAAQWLTSENQIRLGQALIAGGLIGLVALNGVVVAGACTFVAGLGCAPIYPSIVALTPKRFGERASQGLVSLQMACAYAGSMLFPPVFGLIAGAGGAALIPLMAIALLGAHVVLAEHAVRATGR